MDSPHPVDDAVDNTERRIEYMPLDEVIEALVNPKAHDEVLMAQSLDRFGLVELATWDERTGTLVSGHGRTEQVRAARAKGVAPPSGVRVVEDGTWLMPVVRGWASANDEEHRAAIVALNAVGPKGGWDTPALVDVLQGLDNLAGVGFDLPELDDMLALLDEPIVLPDEPSDAAHADLPPPRKGEAPPPREVQGMRDVVLTFQLPAHQQYVEALAVCKRKTGEQVTPLVVLKALQLLAATDEEEA